LALSLTVMLVFNSFGERNMQISNGRNFRGFLIFIQYR